MELCLDMTHFCIFSFPFMSANDNGDQMISLGMINLCSDLRNYIVMSNSFAVIHFFNGFN
jgi:hypothetical protein